MAERINNAARSRTSNNARQNNQQRNNARAANGRKRNRRRKGSYLLYYIMLLMFVAIALITLSVTVLFNISVIRVTGLMTIDTKEIIAASQVKVGDNLFRINLEDVKNRILNNVTDVDKVEVIRDLPATLIIKANETKPSYNIKHNESYVLLSKNYRVIKTDMLTPDSSTIILSGIELGDLTPGQFVDIKDTDEYNLVEEILKATEENNIKNIKEIDVSNPVNISVNYNNQYKILVGAISELSYKFKFAKKVITDKLSSSDRGIIDARKEGQLSYKPNNQIYKKSDSSDMNKNSVSSDSNNNSSNVSSVKNKNTSKFSTSE